MGGDLSDDEPTAAFVIPEELLRRARGDDASPDTERRPAPVAPSSHDVPPTAPHPRRPPREDRSARVAAPGPRRPASRPIEPSVASGPPTERGVEDDTLVNVSRDELLRRR